MNHIQNSGKYRERRQLEQQERHGHVRPQDPSAPRGAKQGEPRVNKSCIEPETNGNYQGVETPCSLHHHRPRRSLDNDPRRGVTGPGTDALRRQIYPAVQAMGCCKSRNGRRRRRRDRRAGTSTHKVGEVPLRHKGIMSRRRRKKR